MNIKLYNTLSKSKEIFTPINEKKIGMYVCGPTVYSRAHIGNARAVVVFDVLNRVLRHKYGSEHVKYVRNITDVDDKINAAAKERDIDISVLTAETTKMFHDDMSRLNCLAPDAEPRATNHIAGMIKMCEELIAKKHAYAAEGHVLFSVKTYEKYGELSRRSVDEMIAGARVEVAPYKADAADFVLWKPSKNDEPGWDSPWGRGRPGWHIECSVMSKEKLGVDFDIHGGGADLQFPHHENEIAQSRCSAEGSTYAKYWVHNGFLSVNGEKMSKSLGNFITLGDLEKDNVAGCVVRFALMSTHYRKPLDWNDKSILDAKLTLDKFYKAIYKNATVLKNISAPNDFLIALYDDMNTPKAIAVMHGLFKKKNLESLKACADLLGLFNSDEQKIYFESEQDNSSAEMDVLVLKRSTARADKNWSEADKIRDEAAKMGYIFVDNKDGSTSYKKR